MKTLNPLMTLQKSEKDYNFELTFLDKSRQTVTVQFTDAPGAWLGLAQFYPDMSKVTNVKLLNP